MRINRMGMMNGFVRLGGRVRIGRSTRIGGSMITTEPARLGGSTRCGGLGRMDGSARISESMKINTPTRIAERMRIAESTEIAGSTGTGASARAGGWIGAGGSRMIGLVQRIVAPVLLGGTLAACAASAPPPERGPAPVAEAPPPVVESPPVPQAPPAAPSPAELRPAPPAVLRALGSEPIGERDLAALGLTGREKPNGVEYRLRQSVPAILPAYVPRSLDGLDLYIADPAEGGWMAFYRDPLSMAQDGPNARFRAVLFGGDGGRRWDVDLNPFLSRPDRLEIQDVRYADGRLYLNEACQSYAREAGGACSSLVSVDPARRAVEWRTPPLTSNNVLLVRGPYLVAGYGFTAEADRLVLVDRATGRILHQQPLDSAHSYLEFAGDTLVVITVNRVYRFRVEPR